MIDLTGLPGGAEMICGGAQQYPALCIRLVCFQGDHVFVTTVGPHEIYLGWLHWSQRNGLQVYWTRSFTSMYPDSVAQIGIRKVHHEPVVRDEIAFAPHLSSHSGSSYE